MEAREMLIKICLASGGLLGRQQPVPDAIRNMRRVEWSGEVEWAACISTLRDLVRMDEVEGDLSRAHPPATIEESQPPQG